MRSGSHEITLPQDLMHFWERVFKALHEGRSHSYMSHAKEFQEQASDRFQELGLECGDLMEKAVAKNDENSANALLSMKFMLNAAFNELGMWIALKDGEAEGAWNALIVAQGSVRCALRSHAIGKCIEGQANHLLRLEDVLFPPQVFVSSGHVVESYECTICDKEYGTCGHVVGRPYMGEMCCRRRKGIKSVDHVAFVEDPLDKRCRITDFEQDDKVRRDKLTWNEVKEDEADAEQRSKDDAEQKPKGDNMRRASVCLLRPDLEPGL